MYLLPGVHQLREEVGGEVEALALGHQLHRARLYDVDAGVHEVRDHPLPGRLLDEAADAAVRVRHDQAVAQRVRALVERHRHRRAGARVLLRQAAEVEVAGRVPAQDEEGLAADEVHAVFHPAGGAEGLVLYSPAQVDAEVLPAAEMRENGRGVVAERGADVRDPVFAQKLDRPLHERLAEQGHHGFGQVTRDGL